MKESPERDIKPESNLIGFKELGRHFPRKWHQVKHCRCQSKKQWKLLDYAI